MYCWKHVYGQLLLAADTWPCRCRTNGLQRLLDIYCYHASACSHCLTVTFVVDFTVALNRQTNDRAMQLNNSLFELNGRCGYVLKPSCLLEVYFCTMPEAAISWCANSKHCKRTSETAITRALQGKLKKSNVCVWNSIVLVSYWQSRYEINFCACKLMFLTVPSLESCHRGALRFCGRAWHSKNWRKLHWIIVFRVSILGAWSFVWGG